MKKFTSNADKYAGAAACLGFYKQARLKGHNPARWRSTVRTFAPVDHLERRARLKENLEHNQRDGMVPVYVWHRDCDQCEGDSITLVPANVMAYERFEARQFEYAEGPMTVYPVSFERYEEFEPSFRDRRAEQYGY